MNELKVGFLALATIVSVVYMSIKVTSNQSGFGEYVSYRTIIRDASGVFPKTPIRVAGINAGKIKDIELTDNHALITFEVLKSVIIAKDSQLRIKTVGFLGDKYLEIIVGEDTERLKELSFITADESGGMENILKDAGAILKDVRVVVSSLKDTIAPKNEKAPIKKILEDVTLLLQNTKEATLSLNRILSGNEEKFNSIVQNLDNFSKDLSYQMSADVEDSAMQDVKSILANAKAMTDDLSKLVSDIKSGKGTIGKLLVEEQIADEVQETLAGVKKLVGKVDSIRTELSLYTGANTNYGSETELGLKIFPSPERFYLLGVSTSEFGPESERYTTTITNGIESTEIKKEKEKDSFRFNIQLGRIIQNWTLRGGLIESTGGIGIDYNVTSWGTRFSFEVFDYRADIGPNLRLSTEMQLWNVLHGKIGFEDLIEDSRSATISAGLKFNDEDLKGLLGFFL